MVDSYREVFLFQEVSGSPFPLGGEDVSSSLTHWPKHISFVGMKEAENHAIIADSGYEWQVRDEDGTLLAYKFFNEPLVVVHPDRAVEVLVLNLYMLVNQNGQTDVAINN